MSLKAGTKLGPYEIQSLIGSGGMGEVYKALDTRLDRIVALKTLRAHLADQPEVKERFEREARTVASLQHEHICVLHDIRKDDGIDYLVLEYIEGETLATKLLNGPLPLAQVLQYSVEISDALNKAHRKGVTHRDIKPGNIMLVKSGSGYSTKLLDFGLAKLKQAAPKEIPIGPDDPTPPLGVKVRPPTVVGTIMGTFQYMSPEQAEGNNDTIDARTDIFSLGAVIYEMVTGIKAFEGKSTASVIAKVLQYEPPAMSTLAPMAPPALERVVKKCLAKEADERWQTATDLHDELEWITKGGGQRTLKPAARTWKRRLALSAVGLLAWAATASLVWYLRTPASQPVSRLTISLPPGQHLGALDQPAIAISPDGKNIVYVASQNREPGASASSNQSQLYLRPLDSNESKPIAGTEDALSAFFSPDGQWIGFFASGMMKKVSINGGAASNLASAPVSGGASWSSQGTVAFQRILGRAADASATAGRQHAAHHSA